MLLRFIQRDLNEPQVHSDCFPTSLKKCTQRSLLFFLNSFSNSLSHEVNMLRILFTIFLFWSGSSLSAQSILVGIAGGTGSGKSTIAEKICEVFPGTSVLVSQDSYYKSLSHLPIEERGSVNFDHPNAIDFDLFKSHLLSLKEGFAVEGPIYDFQKHNRKEKTQVIEPAKLIIVEGILLFAIEEIRELFDLKIFVDTDDDIRILRRIQRDIRERGRDLPSVIEQYLQTVKPMHDAFVAPSKQHADIIIPLGGHNEVALDLIFAKLHHDLEALKTSYIHCGTQ